MYIRDEIYDEELLKELMSSDNRFSVDAYKRALFHSGNENIESALTWLRENEHDLLLNQPIKHNKIRKCPRGHILVAEYKIPYTTETQSTPSIAQPFLTIRTTSPPSTSTNSPPSTMPRFWICDGEDDKEGCRRHVTNENYERPNKVKRFVCEDGCKFNVCDDCVFRSGTGVRRFQGLKMGEEEQEEEDDEEEEKKKKEDDDRW